MLPLTLLSSIGHISVERRYMACPACKNKRIAWDDWAGIDVRRLSPDARRMLLMDHLFRKRGLDPATVSPLDRLSYLGTRTMGALTYHPPVELERDQELLDLHEIGKNAQEIYSGEAVEVLPQLMRAGGSPGGARPKALIGVSATARRYPLKGLYAGG